MEHEPESCLAAALAYAARGWHVLPLHWIVDGRCSCGDAACKSPAKHPLTKRGLSDATTCEATIRNWWNKWPLANVAIRTGEVSQIFVVDVDGEKGQETWRSIRGDEPLSKKEVFVATTGREGGVHLFFKWPEGRVNIKSWTDRERKIDVSGKFTSARPRPVAPELPPPSRLRH